MPKREWPLCPPPPFLQQRYRDAGLWLDRSLGAFVDEKLATCADREVRIWSETHPHRGTIGELREAARRFAGGLAAHGVGPGDVVSYQLPNRVEALIAFYGTAMLGAVLVPIVHFYGPKELRFILEESAANVHVTAASFRGTDFVAALAPFWRDLPALEKLIVIDGEPPDGALAYGDLLRAAPLEELPAVEPDAVAIIAYTSGTTSDPKGVIHVSQSILAEALQLSQMTAGGDRPQLVGAPIAHGIGMLGGVILPLMRGDPIHLLDQWVPGRVLQIMLEADLTAGSGSTFFLTSLLDAPGFGPEHLARMPRIGLGGSPVPAAVSDRAEALGISTLRSYGSTEHPSISGSTHDDPAPKRKYTDGRALPGNEIRLVDEDGQEVPLGEPGEILSRGPERFWGYTDPSLTALHIDADGWYRTEDVGVLDDDGFLTITDRIKDIIIRGGENVSAAEIEELLMHVPGVAEVAVVAAPDARLGEHACAFLRMQPGAEAPGLDAVRAQLAAAGLAKQKWPEEIRGVIDFARTPSGKIKKFVLRQELRDEAGA
jgi:acyl-CoA synthetase (AMP-forming)/AMP-acid ligase II